MAIFEDLGDWAETRDFIHQSLRVLAAVPRKFSPPHPRWWHIGFEFHGNELRLSPVPLPDGGSLDLAVNRSSQVVTMAARSGETRSWSLAQGFSPLELAVDVFAEASRLGLRGLDPGVFQPHSQLRPHPDTARKYFDLIGEINRIFLQHRSRLAGETSPIHLWPHGFDMSFEWFGTRIIEEDTSGDAGKVQAQLNLGWSPGEESHPDPYFYSNPWPFDGALKRHPLPRGASWMDGSWKGTILPHRELIGDPSAEGRLLEYAGVVYELARPLLSEQ